MGVIIKKKKNLNNNKFKFIVKGAPEKIKEICDEKYFPKDYNRFE
jgi:magnesium-transporting ATPase (P-type)